MKNTHPKTEYSSVLHRLRLECPPDGQQNVYTHNTVVITEEQDIPYVPSSMFDSDQVQKNGMAQLLQNVRFSTGSDIEMADNLTDRLNSGLSDVADSAIERISTTIRKRAIDKQNVTDASPVTPSDSNS